MDAQTIFAGFATILAELSLFITLRDKRRQQHEAIISTLQAEKEAVAFVSMQLKYRKWGKRQAERVEIITALGMAWIFENADRTRAMIHGALKFVCEKNGPDVKKVLDDIDSELNDYATAHYTDPQERKKRVGEYRDRLTRLKSALGI